MEDFARTLRHGSGATMSLDPTRLLLALKTLQSREWVEAHLINTSLLLEDTGEKRESMSPANAPRINHTGQRFWIRSAQGQPIVDDHLSKLEQAFGADFDWVGPVYRMPNTRDRVGLLCPLPNVLVVKLGPQPEPPTQVVASAVAAALSLTTGQPTVQEVPEKSKYLGNFHYFVISNPKEHNAYKLREALLKGDRTRVLDVRFESMPMLVPTAVVPNDTLYAQQWNMPQIQAPDGWDISTGSASIVVCVLDEGCDLTHPDLQFSTPGINLGTMMPDGSPTGSHGTACAGIVAGTFNNSAGVAGVAGSCQIMPLAFQAWTDVEVAAGINYAADNGARVISMSFGWDLWDPGIIDPAIQHAFDTDVVMCVATHNYNGPITYPATNPLVIACGASDQGDGRKTPMSPDGECWGSDFGPEISVVAPGVLIPTTDIQGAGGYNNNNGGPVVGWACVNYPSTGDAAGDYVSIFDGTSAATPHVAGLAALIRSAYPSLTNVEVRNVIERAAQKVGAVPYAETAGYPNGTWNQEMGYGRINVFRALDLADVMIRDWPGDMGVEPSTPSGGNFWDFADIVVRIFDDDVFVPSDPTQSKHLELGQTNHLYIRVTNNGPREARDVMVNARLTPFVGTQFVYPADWTAVDATHISPTPVTATFASIPPGGEEIAKFTISAAQVQTLFDEDWHPCLVASVTADNDYAFATAAFTDNPIVVRRNNLAQRNLSVINVLASAAATFPFLAGNFHNVERVMEVVVRRDKLPKAMPLLLALDEGNRYFPQVDLVPPGFMQTDDDNGMVFLETTKIKTKLGCCDGVLTLVKGSRFDCPPAISVGKVSVKGGELLLRDGKRFVEIRDDVAIVRMEKEPHRMYPLALQTKIPANAKAGDQFWISVSQRDESQQTVGGASMIYIVQ